MPTNGAALGPDSQRVQWRVAQEAQSLRDTLTVYRKGASALAARVSELRGEVARLKDALRADRAGRGVATVEVDLELDEYAPGLVGAILVAEFKGTLAPRMLEDAQLVASELVAGSVRRCSGSDDPHGVLRVECTQTRLRLEIESCGAGDPAASAWHADGLPETIVERLSERWGRELTSAGRDTVWAVLADGDRG
jgi:uncharacterized small protein (DUF1192 family)